MQSMVYDTFEEILKRERKNEKTLVVDEFHRLGDDLFNLLHSMKKDGKLIRVSSTLSLSKKLIGERSPLLGLFAEVKWKEKDEDVRRVYLLSFLVSSVTSIKLYERYYRIASQFECIIWDR